MEYAIVDFYDPTKHRRRGNVCEMKIVPLNWLRPDEKKFKWPPYTDETRIKEAVSKRVTPSHDWKTYEFNRIYATTATYDKAMIYLKGANENFDTRYNVQAEKQKTSPAVSAEIMDSMDKNNTKPLLPVPAPKDEKEDHLIKMMEKLLLMQTAANKRMDLLEKKIPKEEEHITKPGVQKRRIYATNSEESANAGTERKPRAGVADDGTIENSPNNEVRRRRSPLPVGQSRSRKHENFVCQPVENQSVIEVPGIGRVLSRNLKYAGYSQARQLLDEFIEMEEDKVKFRKWLHEVCGANLEQFADCYNGLREWRRKNFYKYP